MNNWLNKYKTGGISIDGYKNNSSDRFNDFNIIESPNITMKNLEHPIMAYPSSGEPQIMYPGAEYYFPGASHVLEIPRKQQGGAINPILTDPKLYAQHKQAHDDSNIRKFQIGGNTDPSVVDFLAAHNQDFSKQARSVLAEQLGVRNYDYSAQKNLELLARLRQQQGNNQGVENGQITSLPEQNVITSPYNRNVPQGYDDNRPQFRGLPVDASVSLQQSNNRFNPPDGFGTRQLLNRKPDVVKPQVDYKSLLGRGNQSLEPNNPFEQFDKNVAGYAKQPEQRPNFKSLLDKGQPIQRDDFSGFDKRLANYPEQKQIEQPKRLGTKPPMITDEEQYTPVKSITELHQKINNTTPEKVQYKELSELSDTIQDLFNKGKVKADSLWKAISTLKQSNNNLVSIDNKEYDSDGLIIDKTTNIAKIIKNGKNIYEFPVITGVRSMNEEGSFGDTNHPETETMNTPSGVYKTNPVANVYGYKGEQLLNDKLGKDLFIHNTYDSTHRYKAYESNNPRDRDLSHGCVNCRKQDIDRYYKEFPQGSDVKVLKRNTDEDAELNTSYLKRIGLMAYGGSISTGDKGVSQYTEEQWNATHKMQEGGNINDNPEVKKQKQFYIDYLNSPEFIKRKNIGIDFKNGIDKINNANVEFKNSWLGSNEYHGDISLDTTSTGDLYKKLNAEETIKYVLPHELSHLLDGNINTTQGDIFRNKNKLVLKNNKETDPLIRSINYTDHEAMPSENHADLNNLRYLMYKEGIYNTGERPMTQEDFNKAKNNKNINKNLLFKRLRQNFKDKDIINLNNEVAINNSQQDNSLMRNGGTISQYTPEQWDSTHKANGGLIDQYSDGGSSDATRVQQPFIPGNRPLRNQVMRQAPVNMVLAHNVGQQITNENAYDEFNNKYIQPIGYLNDKLMDAESIVNAPEALSNLYKLGKQGTKKAITKLAEQHWGEPAESLGDVVPKGFRSYGVQDDVNIPYRGQITAPRGTKDMTPWLTEGEDPRTLSKEEQIWKNIYKKKNGGKVNTSSWLNNY